jgi:ABC-2 type transport system ATP-binding protein
MTDNKKEEYWSKFANTFNDDQRYIAGVAIQQALKKRLSEESNLGELIEFGCGAGFFTSDIAANASHVLATDLSDEMLVMARTQLIDLQNVSVEKADCEKTDFPDGKFDSVFMANLVHVIENPVIALRESRRILKNGGLLLIISYTPYGVKLFEKIKMVIRFIRKWGRPPAHYRNLSPDELRSLVESAGFKVEEVQLIGENIKALYLKGRKIG